MQQGTRVAVTGHRHLVEDGALRALVDEALARCEEGPAPWTLVSGLAAGADAVVAGRAHGRAGWAVHALLPLPGDDYAEDFAPGPERDAFASRLARAGAVEVADGPRERPGCYAALGHALVARADLVLAIWNGTPPRGPGGTGEVVALARAAARPLLWLEVADARDATARTPRLHVERWPWA